MSIMLLGGPSAEYITNLIRDNSEIFSQVIANVFTTNINNYISQSISNIVRSNSLNLFSTSISRVIQNYKTDFLTALQPRMILTAPVTITDFTQSAYFIPIYHPLWDLTYPGGGAVRFASNVSSQASWSLTFCGLAFRPFLFVDPTTKHLTVRITVTNISNGNPSSTGASHRHLIGFLLVSHDKLHGFGVGRNGSTISDVTGSGVSNKDAIPNTNPYVDSFISGSLSGSTWEVKIDMYDYYDASPTPSGRTLDGFVRVDGGSWTQITGIVMSSRYEPRSGIYGIKIGIAGYSEGALYPSFGGTVTRLDIDSGFAVL